MFPHMTVRKTWRWAAICAPIARESPPTCDRVFDAISAARRARGSSRRARLSGGEQQMLAIGRALMSRPKLIMFDEPSLGLAPNIVEHVFEIINGIRQSGTTVLMVEQNAYAALDMCDYAYLLESGVIALSGGGSELIDNTHVREAYLGG